MTTTTNRPTRANTITDKDSFGALVAQDLISAERQLDAYLGQMGQLLTTLADGRVSAGLRAKVGQRAMERYGAAIVQGIGSRGELVAFHDSVARAAQVEGINWTVLGGPTETTPNKPVKGVAPEFEQHQEEAT